MTDATGVLLREIHQLRGLLVKQRRKTAFQKSRAAMWKTRARAAERKIGCRAADMYSWLRDSP